jgi:hypothetical protein
VLQLTGAASKLVEKLLPMDDPRQRQPDISLARSVLGWQPQTELVAGLEHTIAYFRDRLLTQQIADLAALARLGRGKQPAPSAAEDAGDPAAAPSAQTA